MNSSGSFYDPSENALTDKLIRQLARGSEELTRSLGKFTTDRQETIKSQKLAIVQYEEEMRMIEEMYGDKRYHVNPSSRVLITNGVHLFKIVISWRATIIPS